MKRVNHSPTSRAEEAMLKKIVPLVPRWVSPDMLSGISLVSMMTGGFFYILYPQGRYYLLLVNLCIFLKWLSDSTDGKVAKFRGISRPDYGDFIDHTFDMVGPAFLFLGLAISDATLTNFWFLFTVILMIVLGVAFLKDRLLKKFYVSFSGYSPTDGLLLIVLFNFLIYAIGNRALYFLGMQLTYFDLMGLVLSIGASILLIKEFILTSRQLSKKY